MSRRPILKNALVAATLFALAGWSSANCGRTVEVPVSSTGYSVVIEGESVRGIYPDIIKSISGKEGCKFAMTPVPRARLERLFETGKADMILAASRSAKRDELGLFVPMVRSRATLISLADPQRPVFKTTQDILQAKDIRLLLVRGYDYGTAYQEIYEAMAKEQRALLEAEPSAVARLMRANPNYVTIMAPTVLYGAMQEDSRMNDMVDKLRFEPLDDLPWGESGVYLSKTAMPPAMFKYLLATMQRTAQTGVAYKGFASYYPPYVLKDGIKPLDR